MVSHPAWHLCNIPRDPPPDLQHRRCPHPAHRLRLPSLPVMRQPPHHQRKNPNLSFCYPSPPSDPADPSPSPPHSTGAQPLAGPLEDQAYLPADHPTADGSLDISPQVKCAVKSLMFWVGEDIKDLALIIPLCSRQQQGCHSHLRAFAAQA